MTVDDMPRSPVIGALWTALAAGRADDALAAFWAMVAAVGAPLIEPLPDEPGFSLLTFLYRGDETTHNVAVLDGPGGGDAAKNVMRRLPGTDLWYITYRVRDDLRSKYRLAPNDSLEPEHEVADWAARTANWRNDPLNPRVFSIPSDGDAATEGGNWSVSMVELPAAPPAPYLAPRVGVAAGEVTLAERPSAALGVPRRVWVYTPPGFDRAAERPYGLLVLCDGAAWRAALPVPVILDNLLAEGRIPPLVAALVDNPGERRLDDLLCSERFSRFLARELVPWLRRDYHAGSEASRAIVGGQSAGGLAAAFAALRHPDTFGNVLSQSGSFWWRPEGDAEHEWLARQYVATPRRALRFYLEVGLLETHTTPGAGPTQLLANRHLRDVLRAKGYRVTYNEFNGGHDYLGWRRTLADGLIALAGTQRR
ncbi:MAG: enterochelin esterase [Ktedonobacterales bacterium]